MQRQALFTISAKTPEYLNFAKALHEGGWKILASGGTAKFLTDGGVEVTDIARIVGKAILGHRVVTLSREVSSMVLANVDSPEDMAELAEINLQPIHLVCVDLYPLEDAFEDKDQTFDGLREKIDIGGRTLLEEAAKGNRFVISSTEQIGFYQELILNPDAAADTVQHVKYRMAVAAETTVIEHSKAARSVYRKQVPKRDRGDSL